MEVAAVCAGVKKGTAGLHIVSIGHMQTPNTPRHLTIKADRHKTTNKLV